MAFEKKWRQVLPILFTSDGTANGHVFVADTAGFKVKMSVYVRATSLPQLSLEIKRVISPTEMIVGTKSAQLDVGDDLSLYTVLLGSTIEAPEQGRPNIPQPDFERSVYEEEPTVAKREVLVDKYGNFYDEDNGFPVTLVGAEINIDGANREGLSVLEIPSPATETFIAFPNGVKSYEISVRDSKDVVKVGLNAGDISLGNYWTIRRGNSETVPLAVDYPNGFRLYFETKSKTDVELEIRYWYKV